jgi:hypothetical protein
MNDKYKVLQDLIEKEMSYAAMILIMLCGSIIYVCYWPRKSRLSIWMC